MAQPADAITSMQRIPVNEKDLTAQPPAPPTRTGNDWKWNVLLLIALALPVFLETLDYTVVATAQSHIASTFNQLNLQSYIGTVYLLTSTVFLPIYASIADIFGRHFALQTALVFFLIGSAISTGGQNMSMVLAGRGIAGIGAAGLITIVRVITADSRSLDSNNWQTSLLFFLYAIGYSVGPVIGGALVNTSWRWVFGINLPCAAAAMPLAFLILRNRVKGGTTSQRVAVRPGLKESLGQKLERVDWLGGFLFVVAGILVILALNWGSTDDWKTARVITCFVVGGVLFVICILWQYYLERFELSRNGGQSFLNAESGAGKQRSRSAIARIEPLLPLEVFRSYDVCAVQMGSFVGGMVMLVMFYFIAIFMTIVDGYSPTKAGVQLVYFAPGMGGGSLISMRLIKNFRQPRIPINLGGVVMCVALGLISMGMKNNVEAQVNGFLAMAGVGVGLTVAPIALQARFVLSAQRNAVVSALTLFFRSLGGTVGLAQCAAVMNSKVRSAIINLVESGSISAADVSLLLSSDIQSLNGLSSLPADIQQDVRNAFNNGVRWSILSLIPWAGVSLFLTLFLSKISDGDNIQKKKVEKELEEKAVDGDNKNLGNAHA